MTRSPIELSWTAKKVEIWFGVTVARMNFKWYYKVMGTRTLFITWIISNLADLEHVASPPAAHATLELVLETHKDLSLY